MRPEIGPAMLQARALFATIDLYRRSDLLEFRAKRLDAKMPSNWQIGDKIRDRWEIRGIEHGGMGVVLVVYDQQLQRMLVAKTFLSRFLRSRAMRDRFVQESQIWIDLGFHRHIVRAEFVQDIEWKPYLQDRWLEQIRQEFGEAWEAYCRTGRLPEVPNVHSQAKRDIIESMAKLTDAITQEVDFQEMGLEEFARRTASAREAMEKRFEQYTGQPFPVIPSEPPSVEDLVNRAEYLQKMPV